MSIKKRSDLFREYARVIDMCEDTEINIDSCVKICGKIDLDPWKAYAFTLNPKSYDFAVAILEGKPVFVGDKVYHKTTGIKCTITGDIAMIDNFSWSEPKETFTLAEYELPLPIVNEQNSPVLYVGSDQYHFNSIAERNEFQDKLNVIIREAMTK